jgi:hypothetical protein
LILLSFGTVSPRRIVSLIFSQSTADDLCVKWCACGRARER